MSVSEHRRGAEGVGTVRCAVITVSDSRTLETDASGREAARLLESAGHEVLERTVVSDDRDKVSLVLQHWLRDPRADLVILTGGTGISRRDGTVRVVRRALDNELPGFGELFRQLSFRQVGPAAMLSRALGGIAAGKAVFSLPGSPEAVQLALEKLILPEIQHLLHEIRK